MTVSARPFFIDAGSRRLYFTNWPAEHGEAGRSILLVPPFAEELNRTRRLYALIARHLAASGFSALLPDLTGTGDSSGAFNDARWALWREDVECAADWLAARGERLSAVFAIRLGSLLALDWAQQSGHRPQRYFFLHPQLDGAAAMRQFLRSRAAADMELQMHGANNAMTLSDIETALGAGETVDISGYPLSGALYRDIVERNEGTAFVPPDAVVSLFGCADANEDVPRDVARAEQRLKAAIARVDLRAVPEPAVWLQMEPDDATPLAQAVARTITSDLGDGD